MALLLMLLSASALGLVLAEDGCPEINFLVCVTRLRIQRVPFDKNMLNVVFSVTSEAKLRHTCRAYNDALPCFRDKIDRCGNKKQRRMLDEVRRMITFFCSEGSDSNQKAHIKHGKCIEQLLQLPATTSCFTDSHPLGADLQTCRQGCYEKREFLCMMQIWISEQSLCTLLDIENKCSKEAAEFYTALQRNVFDKNFPILCSVDRNLEGNSVTNTPPSAPLPVFTQSPYLPQSPNQVPLSPYQPPRGPYQPPMPYQPQAPYRPPTPYPFLPPIGPRPPNQVNSTHGVTQTPVVPYLTTPALPVISFAPPNKTVVIDVPFKYNTVQQNYYTQSPQEVTPPAYPEVTTRWYPWYLNTMGPMVAPKDRTAVVAQTWSSWSPFNPPTFLFQQFAATAPSAEKEKSINSIPDDFGYNTGDEKTGFRFRSSASHCTAFILKMFLPVFLFILIL